MRAHELTEAWVEKRLKGEEIYAYLRDNILGAEESTTYTELVHIAQYCHHIYKWHATDERHKLGDFLNAFINNDLWEACMRADDVNRRSLWIYVQFLYNVAPSNWRDKLKEEMECGCAPGTHRPQK